MAEKPASSDKDGGGDAPPRRNFLVEAAAAAIGVVVGLVPFAAAVWSFLDPAIRKEKDWAAVRGKRPANFDGMIRVASLDDLPDVGAPRRFQVIDDVTNKWNYIPDQPIGSVYLTRQSEAGVVTALNTTCPHAGCSVKMGKDRRTGEQAFLCPCHNSVFELNGAMVQPTPSPREMDALVCEVRDDGGIYVKYQNFHTGRSEKTAKG